MFKSLKISVLLVCLALLGLASLPAYPWTETASAKLRPAEVEHARTLLGENLTGARPDSEQLASAKDRASGGETMTLSVPKLGLEDVPVPTADSQVELDREGIIHLKETGAPWKAAWPRPGPRSATRTSSKKSNPGVPTRCSATR